MYVPIMRLALLCIAFAASAISQVTTGTILGTVTDSSGAPVSAASITITEVNKNTTSKVQSDESGSFSVPFLVPGMYTVSAEKPGFKKGVQSNLALEVDQKARTDFQLAIGNVSETVEVPPLPPWSAPNPLSSARSSARVPSANSRSMAATSLNWSTSIQA